MTRENKLALVVGFALILFVGILVSDHFSTARSQESADLRAGRAVDPLTEDRWNDPNLIQLPGAQPDEASRRSSSSLRPGPVAVNTGSISHPDNGATDRHSDGTASNTVRERADVRPEPDEPETPRRIVMGSRPERDQEQSVPFIFHDVQRGETLTAIARQYYGDGDRDIVRALAQINGLDDPDALRANHRLRIPAPEHLGRAGERSTTPAREQSSRVVYTTHTVGRGETLSEIAQDKLGSARRWREIYELNRDVIDNPDRVPAGTEIKLPRP